MSTKQLKNNIFLMSEKIIYPTDLSTKEYAVFYPTDGYYLSKKQYDIMTESLNEMGMLGDVTNFDIEFMKSLEDINKQEIRNFANFQYGKYKDTILLFENAIVDLKHEWSICIYQDYWGIVYGSKELLDKISSKYDFKSDLEKFVEEVIDEVVDQDVKKQYQELIHLSYIRSI